MCPVVSATTQFWKEFKLVTISYVETDEVLHFAYTIYIILTFIRFVL